MGKRYRNKINIIILLQTERVHRPALVSGVVPLLLFFTPTFSLSATIIVVFIDPRFFSPSPPTAAAAAAAAAAALTSLQSFTIRFPAVRAVDVLATQSTLFRVVFPSMRLVVAMALSWLLRVLEEMAPLPWSSVMAVSASAAQRGAGACVSTLT